MADRTVEGVDMALVVDSWLSAMMSTINRI